MPMTKKDKKALILCSTMTTYIIKNEKDLEKHKDKYGYHIKGNARFEYSAEFNDRLLVDGYLFIEAGRFIEAGGFIKTGGFIKAGWFITAGLSIEAGGFIETGEYIKTGGSIEAGDYIKAGGSIEARGSIEAGELSGISAGLYIICEEGRTITCERLIKGIIEYGTLKETGLKNELGPGKRVRIKLADNQIVEGEIVE